MWPSGSSRRLPLHHATHSSVANSTSSSPFHGPRRWISSVLNNPITVSASALSYESPGHRTAGDGLPFALELLPDFADAVDLAVLPPHPTDVLAQSLVPPRPGELG